LQKNIAQLLVYANQLPEKITSATITTNKGVIEVTFVNDAPETVKNFATLALNNFYNGTRFHRVIRDFMIQGGDPLSKDTTNKARWGQGGPGYSFKDEISPDDTFPQGTLAMANSGPNTNGSQFFIVTSIAGTPWLIGKHTVFGHVTKGLDVALRINDLQTDGADQPLQDVIIEKVEIR
jgi:peptidyl-prolyl cis-trans isomerase A (cyclophilin A)